MKPAQESDSNERPEKRVSKARWMTYIGLAVAALLTDLYSKSVMQEILTDRVISVIDNFLYFRFTWNPGIAFGLMQSKHDILLYIIPVLLVAILIYSYQYRHEPFINVCCMALIFGGALGNYFDRLMFGKVRDFVDVKFGDWYDYPIFNLADAYISTSVAILILASFVQHLRQNKASKK